MHAWLGDAEIFTVHNLILLPKLAIMPPLNLMPLLRPHASLASRASTLAGVRLLETLLCTADRCRLRNCLRHWPARSTTPSTTVRQPLFVRRAGFAAVKSFVKIAPPLPAPEASGEGCHRGFNHACGGWCHDH